MEIDEYVRQQNLELYRKLLAESPAGDPRRILLMQLLTEEKAKEAVGANVRRSK